MGLKMDVEFDISNYIKLASHTRKAIVAFGNYDKKIVPLLENFATAAENLVTYLKSRTENSADMIGSNK